MLTAVSTGTAT